MNTTQPTLQQFTAYQLAYDYFNRTLFGDELTPCMLNLSRKARAHGWYCPSVWGWGDGETAFGADRISAAEISLNPDTQASMRRGVYPTGARRLARVVRRSW